MDQVESNGNWESHLDFEFGADDTAFREQVTAFLELELSPAMRHAASRTTTVFADKDLAMAWQAILAAKGWAVPAWPVEHGGTGWTATQKYIFGEELAKAGAPGLIPLGLRMLAPVLFKYGTEQQKSHYLPRMLSGEHYWCQGYSEPGSGSDLSSLKTTAVKDGDDYIVNGTKIWTTHAQFADHIFCLVRTDGTGRPQHGITFLLMPMDTPGITVEPIITMAADHEVNQVFSTMCACRRLTGSDRNTKAGRLPSICWNSNGAAVARRRASRCRSIT